MGGSISTIHRQQIGTIRLLELNNLKDQNETEQSLNNIIEDYYPEKRQQINREILNELEKNPDNVVDLNGNLSNNSIFIENLIIKYNAESDRYQNMLNQGRDRKMNEQWKMPNQHGGLSKNKKNLMKLYSSRPLRFRKYDT